MSMTARSSQLRTALRRGGLELVYQTQYDLGAAGDGAVVDSRPVAVEALSRWSDPILGEVAPEEFVPLAEQGRFVDELDLDVLGRAVAQGAAWRRSGHHLGLSVNAAPSHFSASYADAAIRIVDSAGLDPAALTIEITETPPPQFDDSMRVGLGRLRAAGIGVSIDDFGAGETTLDMLRTLPIDEVKLDRSLVQAGDAQADEIVGSLIMAAREHGWRVVAEGVETRPDLERSVQRGCHRGQGFLWGQPLSAAAMSTALG